MSPEQARGKAVDRRTDVWAFGCCLYEALTGRRTFEGETHTDRIAAILSRDPDWGALPPQTPPRIRDLLRRCLQRDPQRRLRHIGDARIEIEEALAEPAGSAPSAAAPAPKLEPRCAASCPGVWRSRRVWWPMALFQARGRSAPAASPLMRFAIALPPTAPLDLGSTRLSRSRPTENSSSTSRATSWAALPPGRLSSTCA